MRDNLPATQGTCSALPDHRILALEGPDAVRFAHAQFMSDVASLEDGHWQWSGWLTPKGRVVALFALLRLDARSLWLVLPDADPMELRDALQRFVFRSKVALAVRDDLPVSGCFASPEHASGSLMFRGTPLELDVGTAEAPRALRIGGTPAAHDATMLAHWKAYDLCHGLPRLDASQANAWTPQQLSLDRLHAFSVKKGCYPGQEIVARTHFLGQARRGLAAVSASAPITVGTDVELGGSAIGKVVSASATAPYLALAVLPLERGPGALSAAGLAVREVDLRDGLAR